MNRNKTHYISGDRGQGACKENIAFHEAGHAAAIYINNKINRLPPVFFQIRLKDIDNAQQKHVTLARPNDGDYVATIEGGLLIETFLAGADVTDDYMTAFEADIINILIGPLAEAKYVYECDNELFNPHLIKIYNLIYYGGRLDLVLVSEYLQSLSSDKQAQDKKLKQLFARAFDFLENFTHWQAIKKLANYIYESNKSIIVYEEIVSILGPVESQNNPASIIITSEKELVPHRLRDQYTYQ